MVLGLDTPSVFCQQNLGCLEAAAATETYDTMLPSHGSEMQHSCTTSLPAVQANQPCAACPNPFAAQVWAYAKLSHYCEPLMERFAGEAQGRIDEFSQQVPLPHLQLGLAVSVPAATPESKRCRVCSPLRLACSGSPCYACGWCGLFAPSSPSAYSTWRCLDCAAVA